MGNKNFTNNIREKLVNTLTVTSMIIGEVSTFAIRDLINEIEKSKTDVLNSYTGDNYKVNFLNSRYLIETQMFTDYFRFLKMQDTLSGRKEIKKLPIIEDYSDISEFLEDELSFAQSISSMMATYNCNIYGKILLNKCLDSREAKYLSTLNPFFKSEYDMYNKDIDLEFIKNQMQEYNDHYIGDPNQAYIDASSFLFDLYKTNKEEATNIFNELFNQDLGIYSSDYEDETTIKIGPFVMRRDLLAQMFKEYYEYEVKRYGLNRGEEDDL